MAEASETSKNIIVKVIYQRSSEAPFLNGFFLLINLLNYYYGCRI